MAATPLDASAHSQNLRGSVFRSFFLMMVLLLQFLEFLEFLEFDHLNDTSYFAQYLF